MFKLVSELAILARSVKDNAKVQSRHIIMEDIYELSLNRTFFVLTVRARVFV